MHWSKKKKGNAKIHILEGHNTAIVENFNGITYNGKKYENLELAKNAAEFEYKSILRLRELLSEDYTWYSDNF